MPNWCSTCKANGEYWPAVEAIESNGRYYPMCKRHIDVMSIRRRIDALVRYVAVETMCINDKLAEVSSHVRGEV